MPDTVRADMPTSFQALQEPSVALFWAGGDGRSDLKRKPQSPSMPLNDVFAVVLDDNGPCLAGATPIEPVVSIPFG